MYGPPAGVDALIATWNDALTTGMLTLVWRAYDELALSGFAHVDWTEPLHSIERNITQIFELRLQDLAGGFLPYQVQHGPFEFEHRSTYINAQPPQYDIAFVLRENPQIMWPLEAKVLQSDHNSNENLGDYIETLESRFLTCTYAPFSNGGAMLGYLRSGDTKTVLTNIESRIGPSLAKSLAFPERPHRHSDHERKVPEGKPYVRQFRCHHLIFSL